MREGWEAAVFFVVQMEDVSFFTPNGTRTRPLRRRFARRPGQGVRIAAWDCHVEPDRLYIRREVPVVLDDPVLWEIREPPCELVQTEPAGSALAAQPGRLPGVGVGDHAAADPGWRR